MATATKIDTKVLSGELREIIFDKPHWILRNGIGLLLLIFICLAASTYLISYPGIVNGKAKLIKLPENKKHLNSQPVNALTGNTDIRYVAEIYIAETDFIKIKQGQLVLLKLPDYPFRDFGIIRTEIDSASGILTDSGYLVKALLPAGLLTDIKKQLGYREGLTARAEIVIEDLRLSDRIVRQLRPVVKK